MSAVYNPLDEEALPAALVNQQNGHIQYLTKTKRNIGRLSVIQLIIACFCIGLGVISNLVTVQHDNYYAMHSGFGDTGHRFAAVDGILAGLLALACGCIGVRVVVQKKGRCLFTTYFVLTILTSVATGLSMVISTFVTAFLSNRSDGERLLAGARTVIDIVQFVIVVVCSALVCSIWSKVGGCCCSGEDDPSVVFVQTSDPEMVERIKFRHNSSASKDGKAQPILVLSVPE